MKKKLYRQDWQYTNWCLHLECKKKAKQEREKNKRCKKKVVERKLIAEKEVEKKKIEKFNSLNEMQLSC